MSAALASAYGGVAPAVIYNAFPWSERAALDGKVKDRRDRELPSIHWYSQTLGMGRGLEDLLLALPQLGAAAEVHLRGHPAAGFERWLEERIPQQWRARVFIHPLVTNAELLSRIAEHDIGFAGERSDCRSRDLTVTNKILHYLLAGLAVVASDTAGQREVAVQAPGAVCLYPAGDPQALASRLTGLLIKAADLRSSQAAALAAAERTLSWETQATTLVAGIRKAMRQPPVRARMSP
jgi:glycosyltransferase involved in cell wall biosynthesis